MIDSILWFYSGCYITKLGLLNAFLKKLIQSLHKSNYIVLFIAVCEPYKLNE